MLTFSLFILFPLIKTAASFWLFVFNFQGQHCWYIGLVLKMRNVTLTLLVVGCNRCPSILPCFLLPWKLILMPDWSVCVGLLTLFRRYKLLCSAVHHAAIRFSTVFFTSRYPIALILILFSGTHSSYLALRSRWQKGRIQALNVSSDYQLAQHLTLFTGV